MMKIGKDDASFKSFDAILRYTLFFLGVAFLIINYHTAARKLESWNVLFNITKFYPTNSKSLIHTILLLVIHAAHLFAIVTDGKHNSSRDMQEKTRMIFKHLTRYLLNMVPFMAIQFLIVIYIFYTRINQILANISETISEEKRKDIENNHMSRNMLKEIISRYLRYHSLTGHYNNVFGWPLCFAIMSFVVKFLIDVRDIFYDTNRSTLDMSRADKLSRILQLVVPTVS